MCGFVGYIGGNWNHSKTEIRAQLDLMSKRINHRGPDSDGAWIDFDMKVALSHRRLAILDLSEAGNQPMLSRNKRYVIAYNGEIYNHLELRQQLKNKKRTIFNGHSDTETLLACIEQLGLEKTLKLIKGMFAFALWDREKKCVSLARDRMGEKPLYYGIQKGSLFFGSDLSAIVRHKDFCAEVDNDSISSLLKYNYIPTPYSIYKDINKLDAGSFLTIGFRDKGQIIDEDVSVKKYWCMRDILQKNFLSREKIPGNELINQLEQLLLKSVEKQMISDVPIGVSLSGGIDSTVVCTLMQSLSDQSISSFSIGFDDEDYNEANHAKEIAKYLGTNHHELYISHKEAIEVIPKLHEMYSEPFADASQIPTYLVSKLARSHVTVSLTGDGGDELFGGYNRYSHGEKFLPIIDKIPMSLRRFFSKYLANINQQNANNLSRKITGLLPYRLPYDKLRKIGELLPLRSDDEVYTSLVSICKNPSAIVKNSVEHSQKFSFNHANNNIIDIAHKMMYQDSITYLPDDILVKVDRAAMAVSLETRVPFLDPDLIEFAWSLPLDQKIRNTKGKWILRELLKRHIPKELIERPKMGFAIPVGDWIRGPLRDWAESLLDKNKLHEEGFFVASKVREKFDDHVSGKRDLQHELWGILMFQNWITNNNQK